MLRSLLRQLELLLPNAVAPASRAKPAPRIPSDPPVASASPFTLEFARNPRARHYVLRVRRDRTVRVTIPRGGSEAFARKFAAEKELWIRTQLDRMSRMPDAPAPWVPGTFVWFRGERATLSVQDSQLLLGSFAMPLPPAAAAEDLRPFVQRHLRALATRELPPLVLEAATRHGVDVRRVQVRSQRTRWGSCSRQGTISLNWRLVQTPLPVRDYLIAHELAHLRQLNHSNRFWRVVEEFFPEWRDAEGWLRRHGREIMY